MEFPKPCGRASNDLFGEKTASASESLANNLAANATNGEETVHEITMAGRWRRVKGPQRQHNGPISAMNPPRPPWLIIVYDFEANFTGRGPPHQPVH